MASVSIVFTDDIDGKVSLSVEFDPIVQLDDQNLTPAQQYGINVLKTITDNVDE